MRVTPLVFLASCFTTAITAQTFISDSNASFGVLPTSIVGDGNASMTATTCAVENLFSFQWCYSVPNSGSGTVVDDVGHGNYQRSTTSTSITQTISDVDGISGLGMQLTDVITSSTPESGWVHHANVISNNTSSPIDLKVYLYWDVDLNDSDFNDYTDPASTGTGARARFIVRDGDPCRGCFECASATPVDRFGTSSFNDPFGLAFDISAGADLDNTSLPFSSPQTGDDFTGAFQWNLRVPAFGSVRIDCASGHNDLLTGDPRPSGFPTVGGSFTTSGLATTNAMGMAPAFTNANTGAVPTAGAAFDVTMSMPSLVAGAQGFVLIDIGNNGGPGLTFCGINLAFLVSDLSVRVPFNGGSGQLRLPASCNPFWIGTPIGLQLFAIDVTGPCGSGIALIASELGTVTFGD